MKIWLTKFLLLFLGMVIAFLAGEVGLRAKRALLAPNIMEYDGKTGLLRLPPYSQQPIKTACWENTISANSQGFHDTEFKLEKPDDVFRIVILGDSMLEAYQVPIKDSFQYLLEERLNNLAGRNKKFEVYSFGVGGIGTFKHHLYLNQYVLKYKPDLVVLSFLPINDFGNDFEARDDIFDKNGQVRKELPLTERISNYSVLMQWLKAKWRIAKTYVFRQSVSQVPFDFQVFLKEYPESWQKIWDLEKTLIGRMNRTSRESGAKFLLISLPDMWRTHPYLIEKYPELQKSLAFSETDFDKPEKLLEEIAKENNFAFLNLTIPFREKAKETKEEVFFWACDGHWNKTGHLWAQDMIFNYFQGQKELLAN